jgi:hypothetical protein
MHDPLKANGADDGRPAVDESPGSYDDSIIES